MGCHSSRHSQSQHQQHTLNHCVAAYTSISALNTVCFPTSHIISKNRLARSINLYAFAMTEPIHLSQTMTVTLGKDGVEIDHNNNHRNLRGSNQYAAISILNSLEDTISFDRAEVLSSSILLTAGWQGKIHQKRKRGRGDIWRRRQEVDNCTIQHLGVKEFWTWKPEANWSVDFTSPLPGHHYTTTTFRFRTKWQDFIMMWVMSTEEADH